MSIEQKLAVFETGLAGLNARLVDACDVALNNQPTTTYRDGTVQTQGHLNAVFTIDSSLVEIHSLYNTVNEAIKVFRPGRSIKELWLFANKSPKSIESNVYHDHPGYDIAGCYYAKVPLNSGGNLEFKDPALTIIPQEGMLVLFEATHWHRVTDITCDDQFRYSIAFNCKFT